MLRLRPPAGAVDATATVRGTDVAEAELILSAICAMKVPRPIMIAAKIIMLRITPLEAEARFHHAAGHSASDAAARAVLF
jgi:hypothetical protein